MYFVFSNCPEQDTGSYSELKDEIYDFIFYVHMLIRFKIIMQQMDSFLMYIEMRRLPKCGLYHYQGFESCHNLSITILLVHQEILNQWLLVVPSHYQNQCWLIITSVLHHLHDCNSIANTQESSQNNVSKITHLKWKPYPQGAMSWWIQENPFHCNGCGNIYKIQKANKIFLKIHTSQLPNNVIIYFNMLQHTWISLNIKILY